MLPASFRQTLNLHTTLLTSDPWSRSYLSLVNIMSFAREMLYSNDSSLSEEGKETSLVTFLEQNRASLLQWREINMQLQGILSPSLRVFLSLVLTAVEQNTLRKLCTNMDYYYAKLYVFSIALGKYSHRRLISTTNPTSLHEAYQNPFLPYLKETQKACLASLRVIIEDSPAAKALKLAPIRVALQTVCAAVFLIKALLVELIHEDELTIVAGEIRDSTSAFKVSALDDLHMSLRYVTFVDGLLNSTLRILEKRRKLHKSAEMDGSLNHVGTRYGAELEGGGYSGIEDDLVMDSQVLGKEMTMQLFEDSSITLDWGQTSVFDLLDSLVSFSRMQRV